MQDGTSGAQLVLFHKRLAWQELPRKIRDRTLELVTTLCVEIVMEAALASQEQDDEFAED